MRLLDEHEEISTEKENNKKDIGDVIVFCVVNFIIILISFLLIAVVDEKMHKVKKSIIDYKEIDYSNIMPIINGENGNFRNCNYKKITSYTEFKDIMTKIKEITTRNNDIIYQLRGNIDEEFFEKRFIIIQDINREKFISSYDLGEVFLKKNILKIKLVSQETKLYNEYYNGTLMIMSFKKNKDIQNIENEYIDRNSFPFKEAFENMMLFVIFLFIGVSLAKNKKKTTTILILLILYIAIKFCIEFIPLL